MPPIQFGVDKIGYSRGGKSVNGLAQLLFSNTGKIIDTRVDGEGFHAQNAGGDKTLQVTQAFRDNTAPETAVHPQFALQGLHLLAKRIGRGGHRCAVQRHINHRGNTTGSGRLGCRIKPFPLGATRFVDMHMGIHQAGHYHSVGDDFLAFGVDVGIDVQNAGHLALTHYDCSGAQLPVDHNAPAAQNQGGLHELSLLLTVALAPEISLLRSAATPSFSSRHATPR